MTSAPFLIGPNQKFSGEYTTQRHGGLTYSYDATFHQVRLDFGAEPVAGGRLGHALLWMMALLLVGFVIAARALASQGARPRPLAPPAGGKEPRSSPARPKVR